MNNSQEDNDAEGHWDQTVAFYWETVDTEQLEHIKVNNVNIIGSAGVGAVLPFTN
jgi:hypothetical protein